ncbi:MAG: CPBP family intramembrane metalloprotease [Candidatus Mcinerneyibacterium aminivorans]|uniref:CPBP family intramembrane metalloprotease n=1 Tax=Candidatus Mcinerneyibacterium aminivorans TaxID=2703815 RepID=A0A5D0MG20_9BACT|nr:MAG: CPBP family intramembrane metalloprotease [Candidatus Mcinerneyibacterium aminivorans]
MLNKKGFWIVFTIIFIAATIFSVMEFDKMGDIIDLNIKMDRKAAVEKAKNLAAENGWGPENARSAVSFSNDWNVQTYVELEGGGKQKFKEILKEDVFEPYKWEVRLFKENKTNEASIYFTPEGDFYQFTEKIPENEKGPSLKEKEALDIARESTDKFGIKLASYELIESTKETMPSGRVDHTFEFEHKNKKLNEAKYRYRFVVSGNRVTKIQNYVKIPEGFNRRYDEMRSKNSTLSTIASVAAGILYLIIGTLFVIFIYSKKNQIEWKKPIIIGFTISFFSNFLIKINQIPFMWNFYDTALSANVFIIKHILTSLIQFFIMGIVISLTFIAAECITRQAFSDKIQFLKVWAKKVAASSKIFKYTILGLFLVSFFIGYEIVFQIITDNLQGWWSPSRSLIDPNILSSYFPWLNPIARSLQAGFWEECLFRAIPIGGAYLLGKKFGKKKLWVFSALILQALIFGAAHASYAQQPAFARVFELFIPSLVFGLLYINFGLLPGIIMHFAYDAVLMSTPIFVSSGEKILISKIIAVALIVSPLLFVLYRRLKNGEWYIINEKDLNKSWEPDLKQIDKTKAIKKSGLPKKILNRFFILGVIGLLAWTFFGNFSTDTSKLKIGRSSAVDIAKKELKKNNIELSDKWKIFTKMPAENNVNDKFIWKKGGKRVYDKLMGKYLAQPQWEVRFAKFVGDVKERKEEYRVEISNDGNPEKIQHIIPEHWKGKSLSEKEARKIAEEHIKNNMHIPLQNLEAVKSSPQKRPERMDWTFIYKDKNIYPLETGEARVKVTIAGDDIINTEKYVHIPEQWSRQNRNIENTKSIFKTVSIIILMIVFIIAIALGIIKWKRDSFDKKLFIKATVLLFGLNTVSLFLNLPETMFNFKTSMPFIAQMFIFNAMSILGVLLLSIAGGFVLGYLFNWTAEEEKLSQMKTLMLGLSVSAFAYGAYSIVNRFIPQGLPVWPGLDILNSYSPIIQNIASTIFSYIMGTILLYFIILTAEKFTANWNDKKILGILYFVIIGFVIIGSTGIESLYGFLFGGLGVALAFILFYVYLFRYNTSVIPFITLGLVVFSKLKQGLYGGYSNVFSYSIITIIVLAAFAYYTSKKLIFSK